MIIIILSQISLQVRVYFAKTYEEHMELVQNHVNN